MRPIAPFLIAASTTLACASPNDEPAVGPMTAVMPSVFPVPTELVDDRAVVSTGPITLPDRSPGAHRADAAPSVVATAPAKLSVSVDSGTLMYPSAMRADGAIWFRSSHPVTAAALAESVELLGAASKEDLVAWRTKRVPVVVEAVETDALTFFIRPEAPFEVGHWYRLRVAPSLASATEGVEPLGSELVSYFRGPEPLRVTSVSCGWSGCTPEDRWIVSFNDEVAADSLGACFKTFPALDLGPPSVEGWSVVFHPKSAKVGREYRLLVGGSCKSVGGQDLSSPYEAKLAVEAPRARLSLARGTGYIPPRPDGRPPAINVGAAYTGKLAVGMTRLTRATLPAFLAKNLQTWGGLSFDEAGADTTEYLSPAGAEHGQVDVAIPLAQALGSASRGLVYLRVESENIGETDEPPLRQALIQVTELGLSVKFGPEVTLVWVTSLVDRTPLSGVTITGLDAAGKALWTATSDERGIAMGAGVGASRGDDDGGAAGGELRVVMASRGDDLAFIDLADYDNRSEPYEFGISQAWDATADALRGIVFTERGVFRAGETVHIKGLLRLERAGKLDAVDARTVSVRITDPLGDHALSRDVPLGRVGDFELDLPLSETARLGTWRIEASAAPAANGHVTGSFRVEAYRPNTFEVKVGELTRTITSAASKGAGDTSDTVRASAVGRYYYGAAMADATARWWLHRADATFSPKGYDDFAFEVPRWSYSSWEPDDQSVDAVASGEGVLDADGALAIAAPIDALADSLAKGPQTLTLEVEVSDVDQQTVSGRASMRIESADHYLGLRAAPTFVGVGEPIALDAAAVSPDGEAVVGAGFEVRFIQRVWKSRYELVAGGARTWHSEPHEIVLARRHLTSAATPVQVSFTPPSSGLYWIEAEGKDAKGRVMRSRESVWVWGHGASWANNDEGHVELVAAQNAYAVGDTARFVVQSPFESARALVTVEANGIVYQDTRVLEGTAPLVEIPVTDAMMPNAFVSVVLLGAPKQPASAAGAPVDHEVRLGYQRIEVDTSQRRAAVTITPDKARHQPGDAMRVQIDLADAAGNPIAGQVTFMAVDEGVLSLTGYRTPDPHKAFFRERSLAIVTSEARSQLWSRLVADDGMKSDWGGGGEGGEATNYRAAFATTAAYFPDVAVGADGRAEVSFKLPDNLTTFRLMAVAATEDGRFGNGESSVEVQKPLLVRPGLPRFLSVGDRFDARAVIQAVDPEIGGDVEVTLSVSGPVVIEGDDVKKTAAGRKATPVVFGARATEPGTATFAFKVVGNRNGERVDDGVQIEIPVVWPAAVRQSVSSGRLAPSAGDTATTIAVPDWVRDDIGGIEVTLTSTRLGELLPGLDYLLRYPYGCVEQTTGGTLPLLALSDLQSGFELPGIGHDQVLVRAQAGLDRLRTMQTWSGGLGYWPGDTTPHPWGSVYAGMALVRASKMPGLDVPAASIERLTGYLRDILRDQAASAREEWHSEITAVKPFAAYVLALAGTPEPAFHASLFAERATLPDFGKLLLALAIDEAHGDRAMALTLLDEVVATARVDGRSATLERDADHAYWTSTMDSDVRSLALLAMALQALRPEDPLLAKVQQGLLDARAGGHWMSTQDNAFAVLALAKTFLASERAGASFVARVELDGQVWLEEPMTSNAFTPVTLRLPMYVARRANGKQLVIKRTGDDAPLYFALRFDYAPREIPAKPIVHGFEITRRYRIADGPRAGKDLGDGVDLAPGELVRVDLTVRTAEPRRYVAVDDPLPAGLEPVTLDFATTRSSLAPLTADDAGDGYDSWYRSSFNHKEQRDDRVVAFADVMDAGEHTYTYLARATTAGSFLAPAARVHEMYHPDVFGQTSTRQVAVR